MTQIESVWRDHRRRVFDVGYRMLGSVTEADDVVQETSLRLIRDGLDGIDDVEGWLVTVAARVCLDRLRATARHEGYAGPWLPEPIVSGRSPEERVTLDDSVRMALLVTLEQLSPAERTSFLLHDVFGLPFDEIATIVGRTTAACRQLASRARRRVSSDSWAPRTVVDRAQLEDVATRFAAACSSGSFDQLVAVLDPDACGDFDSGGLIPGAPLATVHGAEAIAAQLVASFAGLTPRFEVADVNGEPGVIVVIAGRMMAVISLESDGLTVHEIHAVGNPDKLAHLAERDES